VLKTRQYEDPVPYRSLVHGGIMHGGQTARSCDAAWSSSSYFGHKQRLRPHVSRVLPDAPRPGRAVIGAWVPGSIIAYGREGDTFRFYERSIPQVVELAHREFTFIGGIRRRKSKSCLGDGRPSVSNARGEPAVRTCSQWTRFFRAIPSPLHLPHPRGPWEIYLRAT